MLGGQDGAIYGKELFRFETKGQGFVYDISGLNTDTAVDLHPFARFTLDRADEIMPHCNSVCFGSEFYSPDDTYPLLYCNVYNNYAKAEEKMLGACLVYRVQRAENTFITTLVQLIEIGFCENASLWKAYPDKHGVRPYGNFVIDREKKSYWAFVMRNEELGTRYFRFDLPSVHDGEIDSRFNVKRLVLNEEDIREYFDGGYHRFMQGATFQGGKIYSTEGFNNDTVNRPAIRVVDTSEKNETYFDIMNLGLSEEAEFISFYGDTCVYSDGVGNIYCVEF